MPVRVFLTEMGCDINEVVGKKKKKTWRKWRVLLGLFGKATDRMIAAVKDFVERTGYAWS